MTTSKLKSNIIIGLAGRHNTGKSTIAGQLELILTNHDFLVEVISFGDCIKKSLAEATGGTVEQIEQLKNSNLLTRWILEEIGAKYFNRISINKSIYEFVSTVKQPSIIVIDGVRMIADEQLIHNTLKGVVVLIDRPLRDDRKNIIPPSDPLPTEVEIPQLHIDYMFSNDSWSLTRLRTDLRQLVFGEIFNRPNIKEKMV